MKKLTKKLLLVFIILVIIFNVLYAKPIYAETDWTGSLLDPVMTLFVAIRRFCYGNITKSDIRCG